MTISGNSFGVKETENGATSSVTLIRFNYSSSLFNNVYKDSSNFTVSGTLPNLGTVSYVVTTTVPFESTTSYPYKGSMTVKATDNTALRLTAIDSTYVQIELDKNADGTFEESSKTTWTALESRV